jgi:hypothetical protein
LWKCEDALGDSRWQLFLKVPCIVTLYSKHTAAMTFENACQCVPAATSLSSRTCLEKRMRVCVLCTSASSSPSCRLSSRSQGAPVRVARHRGRLSLRLRAQGTLRAVCCREEPGAVAKSRVLLRRAAFCCEEHRSVTKSSVLSRRATCCRFARAYA